MAYAKRIKPGDKVDLSNFDPDDHDGLEKEFAEAETARLGQELSELQELLFAAGQQSLLIVLQGLDTSGKDGTIKRISDFVNVQGCDVVPFKVPTEEDLAHDFLWRIHKHTPAKGHITIFNRSHYEDVIVVRVHDLVPKSVWKPRFELINRFEELLVESNTLVLKFFLHISKKEQEQRLLDREKETDKAWKLSVGDWQEREKWSDYTDAYAEMLERCSTDIAPWIVVPADHKWFRDLAVIEAVVSILRPCKDDWIKALKERGKKAKAEIDAFRAK